VPIRKRRFGRTKGDEVRVKSRRVLPLAVMVLVAWSLGSTLGVDPTGAAEEPTPVSTCGTALIAIPGADQVLPVDVARGTTGTPISIPGADVVSISPDARTAYVVADHAVVP
jgi:hypothetical protein